MVRHAGSGHDSALLVSEHVKRLFNTGHSEAGMVPLICVPCNESEVSCVLPAVIKASEPLIAVVTPTA